MDKYSSLVLRIGMGLVLFWFGFSQVFHPSQWVDFLPTFMGVFGIPLKTIILLNGSLEIIAGLLLVLGLFTRLVAVLLAIHMFGIVISVGYGPTGVRDFGLAVALASLALSGAPYFSLDSSNAFEEKTDTLTIQ